MNEVVEVEWCEVVMAFTADRHVSHEQAALCVQPLAAGVQL